MQTRIVQQPACLDQPLAFIGCKTKAVVVGAKGASQNMFVIDLPPGGAHLRMQAGIVGQGLGPMADLGTELLQATYRKMQDFDRRRLWSVQGLTGQKSPMITITDADAGQGPMTNLAW